VDIVVRGRKTEVPERFRRHVSEKLAKVAQLDPKVISLDVELSKEHNPRLSDHSDRIELTCLSRGPVIRAEAAADDAYAALDLAYAKLEARLRRAADRRRVHHGNRTPQTIRVAGVPEDSVPADLIDPLAGQVDADHGDSGPMVIREKVHEAKPMNLDQALYEMELVGHDFFLFVDAESSRPSVVYRRRAYDYGVIRLAV
jgi:ribosomal subunit interface protein